MCGIAKIKLELVFIGEFAHLFGEFCRLLRQRSLQYVSIPADFFLVNGKITLEKPHIFPMNTGSYTIYKKTLDKSKVL